MLKHKTHHLELTAFTGSIYADPSRALYRILGMNIENKDATPKGETRKSYLTQNAFAIAVKSIWVCPFVYTQANTSILMMPAYISNVLGQRGLSHAGLIGKQGNFGQLGGEFVFGPGETCSFASRMRHTEDRK